MKAKVILNPYANRWGARDKTDAVKAALNAVGLDYDLVATKGPGDGTAVAAQAINEGYDTIIAAGGDGTINEVINGLLPAAGDGPSLPFGIIPIGTANDFNLMAGLPASIDESVAVIAAGHTRLIDAGMTNGRYFINNSAAAMEPMVTLETHKIQRLSGEIRYIAGLIKAIIKIKAWHMELSWDDGSYVGSGILLSVCNSPRTGGFTMAPGAEIDDGRFDFVFAPAVPKLTLMRLLVKLMQGKHVEDPLVTFQRATYLTVSCQPGTPVHTDGEVFSTSETSLDFRILPGKVNLLSPKA